MGRAVRYLWAGVIPSAGVCNRLDFRERKEDRARQIPTAPAASGRKATLASGFFGSSCAIYMLPAFVRRFELSKERQCYPEA